MLGQPSQTVAQHQTNTGQRLVPPYTGIVNTLFIMLYIHKYIQLLSKYAIVSKILYIRKSNTVTSTLTSSTSRIKMIYLVITLKSKIK